MPSASITQTLFDLSVIPITTSASYPNTDQTPTDNAQNDVFFELSRGMFEDVLAKAGADFIAVTARTRRYTLPTTAKLPLAIFYGPRYLYQIRKDESWATDPFMQQTQADHVVGVIFDPENRTQFALVPPPSHDGRAINPGDTPLNFTGVFPEGNVTVLYTRSDLAFPGDLAPESTYSDLQLPIAIEVMAREYERDSNHQDSNFAQVCHTVAKFFFGMFVPKGLPT